MTLKASNYPTIRPSLDLNFAQTKRLDPRITFSRASTGTYYDANGVLQSAPAGVARFDHNPVSGESLGLLLEDAGTNLLTYSEEFNNAAWPKSNATVTANAVVAPDGTNTADKLVITSSSSGLDQRYCFDRAASTVGGISTQSVFVKKEAARYFVMGYHNFGGRVARYLFDLDTKTFQQLQADPNYGAVTAKIDSLPNGWLRLSMTVSVDRGGNIFYFPTTNSNVVPTDGTSGIYVWGAQLEASPYATSYIPTTSSTATRAADVCTVTNSNIYDTDSFTIVNQPFGASAGGSTLTLFDGPQPIKRATVYTTDLSQTTINAAAGKTDEFWRWRVLGSSFALPNFLTDGQVTVDWGDGTIETLTTAEHTFSNGSGYHDIGFRLDSGTYFRPYINGNPSHDTKVVALGPAPESMKLNGDRAFYGCNKLEAFDAIVDVTGGTNFYRAWNGCSSLTSFPLINTAAGTNFSEAWRNCSSLTSFPEIDTAAGTNFTTAWRDCSSLTSFPLINTAAGTNFSLAWYNCTGLTSFPLINTAAGTNFGGGWYNCSSLTSFPLIDTSSGTSFGDAWSGCNSLTSFPLINTAAGINFNNAWRNCRSLTSFPLIDTSSGTSFNTTWFNCTSLTSFPLINTAAGTNFAGAWNNCNSLTSFPLINTAAGTSFALAWLNCSSLTSFPLIDTAAGTSFESAWQGCSSLTSFPLINTAASTRFVSAWQGCSSLTSFPLINTAAGTNFFRAWLQCSSLTSFPLIDVSAGTNFSVAWNGCTSLTDFPANFFDSWTGTPVNNCFFQAWDNCSALTATSVENILNSIDTSGQSAPASGVDITIDYNAGTGTPSVATAIINLKSRGWTITLNGVAQ